MLKAEINSSSGDFEIVDPKFITFSGGELHIQLDEKAIEAASVRTGCVNIELSGELRTSEDVVKLFLFTDALRGLWPDVRSDHLTDVHLTLKYLPYARQDRYCAPGQSFSLQALSRLINAQEYETVTVWDVHSEIAEDHLDGFINETVVDLFPKPFVRLDTVLVSPDKGAITRVRACASAWGMEWVEAEKVRNPANGQITHTSLDCSEDIGDRDFLIVDDICDGGRTFIELAKVLRPLTSGKVELYVTHGIFSAGLNPLLAHIDKIYVANMSHSQFKPDSHWLIQLERS